MSNTNSILGVDFGSVQTRLVLIDLVDGSYRLVSRAQVRTTNGFPANDIMVGLQEGVRQISDITARRLVNNTGRVISPEQLDRSGVDLFAVTASVGRPLRAVVVGLISGVSIASAIRAISTNYINVASVISLDDKRDEEGRVNEIVLAYPDVVVITGGTQQGARAAVRELTRTTALAVSLIDNSRRPSVIYTGNSALHDDVRAIFDGITDVLIAENVRPSLDDERLDSVRLQLGQAYDNYAEQRSESFARISEMSQTGVLPSAQGYGVLAEYLSSTGTNPVALLDIGSASSTLAVGVDGHVQTSINTEIGLGHSAETLLETVGIEAIRFWLPFNISERDLLNFVANKSLQPASIPGTLRDLHIEHAMLKAGAQHMLKKAYADWEFESVPFKRIIGAGGALTGTGNPAYDTLLLLDVFQPAGVTIVDTDPFGLVPVMGAIAPHVPGAVVQLMDGNNLRRLAVVVSADGRPRRNRPAFKLTFENDLGEVWEERVNGGHLWRTALPSGRRATVTIRGLRGASVNGKRSVKLKLGGELAGLVIDARGRPLSTGKNVSERAELIPMWIAEMTDDPLREIAPELLEAVVEKDLTISTRPKERQRRGLFRRGSTDERSTRRERSEEEVSDEELAALFRADGLEDDQTADDELDELRNVLS